jgi:transposase
MKAFLVFLDESGFLMAPLVRRSWAPKGQTPILLQRTQSHQKVSAIAVLCISPKRDLVYLYFRLHPDANINGELVLQFLKHLRKQLKNHPLILVWDRFLAHRAKKVQSYITNSKNLSAEHLPPYAPELNPLENVWGYLKMNSLANDPQQDVSSLAKTARHHGRSIQRQPSLLRSFVKHIPLFLRLK